MRVIKSKKSLLLEPLEAGTLSLGNRLVMPPMATAKAGNDGKVSRELLDYYNEKTAGGYIGLVIVEHSYVHPEGKAGERQLSAACDSTVDGLRKLVDLIHRNGSKTVMQINHAGSAASADVTGTAPVGPSEVIHPYRQTVPRQLTGADIDGIVTAFQHAARRAREAGFNGVEIHSAHGYLLNQFYSPLTNRRTDQYGGDLKSRIHLHLRIVEAVRQSTGEDFPILLRLGASDFKEGGTTIQDSQMAAVELVNAGVNILDISGGFTGFSAPGRSGQGYFAPLSEAIKKVVSIPVILTGGITRAESAEMLLAEGKADLIGVGRAILEDSAWARRAVESLAP